MDPRAHLAWRVFRALLGVAGVVLFILGAADQAAAIGAPGWSEVFVIVSGTAILILMFPLYNLARRLLPPMPASRTLAIGMRVLMLMAFVVQTISFMIYLVYHISKWCYLFLIADVILFTIGTKTRLTAYWATGYTLVTCTKMCVLWPELSSAVFNSKDNPYGPNGLKALLLLIMPMIQLPVLTARLAEGTDLFDAYTQNMAAVFTHTLNVLDGLDMYLLGTNRNSFPVDVQYMLLMFAIMGLLAANLYHVLLYFGIEDATESQLRVRRLAEMSGLSAKEGTRDERLLHYLLWLLFFMDLPFAAVRFIAFMVHSTRLSVFAAKNGMMMVASVMLILKHSKS